MICEDKTSQAALFECDDGREIPMTYYCDFKDDCLDRSDEIHCSRSPCAADEFECTNKECISMTKRCDLLLDCKDESDEEACTTCADEVFQCFDSSCISGHRRCDGIIDCAGAFNEDESESCKEENIEISCEQWHLKGFKLSNHFTINPGTHKTLQRSLNCDYLLIIYT